MKGEHPYEELSAYADGELSEEKARAVDEHLESCETCRARLEAVRSSQHRLAELGASREPTDALRREIERKAEESTETDEGTRTSWFVGLTPTRFAGVVVAVALAVGVGYYFGAWQNSQIPGDWEELLVRDHMRSKPAAKPMDVTGDDPAVLVDYFRGKVSFEPVVPRVPGASLMGGRLCKLAGDHVELLFYRHEGRVLSLFVADDLAAPSLCRSSRGHSVCVRDTGELRLMLVGRGSRQQMKTLLADTDV